MAYTDIVEIGIDEELIQGQGYEIKIPFGVGWVTEWFQPGLTSQVTENLWQLYTNCGWDVHSIIVDANTTYVFGIWQGSDNTWENIWSYFENVFTDKGKKAFLVSLSNTGFITGMPPGITIDQLKSMTPAQINKLYNDLYGELQGVKTNVRGQVKWNVAIICGTIIFVTGAVGKSVV